MMSAGLRPTGSGAATVPAAATPRAGAERFFHDAPDRGGATSALRAASQAAIDLGRRARRRVSDGGTHLDIGEHVAGADDHGDGHGLEGGRSSDKHLRGPMQKEILLSIHSNLSIAVHPLNPRKNTPRPPNYNSSKDGPFD